MNELRGFAETLLSYWNSCGGNESIPLPVSELLDRVFTYPLARRSLGIDASEDYEALVLRLLSGEEGLASVSPEDAGELARATMADRLPDLTVLQLLRGATLTFSPTLVTSRVAEDEVVAGPLLRENPPPTHPDSPPAQACWSCGSALPRPVNFCTQCGADQRAAQCSGCGGPMERDWKFCPNCGGRAERGTARA